MIATIPEAMNMIVELLEEKSPALGVKFVGSYGEGRLPAYPAVVVNPGPRDKELHATNTFQVLLVVNIFVLHGAITLTYRERTKADLELAVNIESALEADYEWKSNPTDPNSKRVIFGYIAAEQPGELMPRGNQSDRIVSTRMTWRGLSQRRF